MNNMNNLERALELSRQNAARNEEARLLEARMMSRQNAENDLYEDIRMQMEEYMVDKPHARRRIIAVAGLDSVLLMGGDEHVRVVRDEIMNDIYSDIPVQMDPLFAEAEHILAEFGDDPLVERLMAIHEAMSRKEKEAEEASMKAIRNAMNAARAASAAAAAVAAPAPAPAPGPTPANNRRTLAAKRDAMFDKKKEGGRRRGNRVTRRKRRTTRKQK